LRGKGKYIKKITVRPHPAYKNPGWILFEVVVDEGKLKKAAKGNPDNIVSTQRRRLTAKGEKDAEKLYDRFVESAEFFEGENKRTGFQARKDDYMAVYLDAAIKTLQSYRKRH
jgi:hypothetical protein